MPIVTLTTDFGLKDYHLAALKGALLSRDASLNIVDITHNVENYDIVQAAFIFRNAWPSFPEGSIHLLSVNNYHEGRPDFLVLKRKGHYFIGPDNGLFSLIFSDPPEQAFRLDFPAHNAFPLKEIFSRAIAHLVSDAPLKKIGKPAGGILQRLTFQPVIGPSQIRGSVIYIDNYENAIVNIRRELFEKVGQNRPFSLYFKRHDPITRISDHYQEVPVGETLCLFNSAGYLEVAINMGKAGSLLGLGVEETAQIDFHGELPEEAD